jgi:hypothetical protein
VLSARIAAKKLAHPAQRSKKGKGLNNVFTTLNFSFFLPQKVRSSDLDFLLPTMMFHQEFHEAPSSPRFAFQ